MQKSEQMDDLRVRRTRKILLEALLELTVEKGFNAVTVRDITERAMVNRSTFYRHYLDKYELLDQYIDEVGALSISEEPPERRQQPEDAPPGLVKMLDHIQQYAAFYRAMLGPKGDPAFTERLRQNIANRFRYLLGRKPPEPGAPPLELKLYYSSSAGIGGIVWWLQNNQPCSTEQLALWLSSLTQQTMAFPPM